MSERDWTPIHLARWLTIKPFSRLSLADKSRALTLFAMVDRWGRLDLDPAVLAPRLFLDRAEATELGNFAYKHEGLFEVYGHNDDTFAQVVDYDTFLSPRMRKSRKPSVYPEPPSARLLHNARADGRADGRTRTEEGRKEGSHAGLPDGSPKGARASAAGAATARADEGEGEDNLVTYAEYLEMKARGECS